MVFNLDERYRDDKDVVDRRSDKNNTTRRYEENEDQYRRSGSRNAINRDRDPREKGKRYGDSQGYFQQQQYGFVDQYAYYQHHQQYYETLRRTNPQAYAEWYSRYYAQMHQQQQQQQSGGVAELSQSVLGVGHGANDGRESVHSGRSSADKDRYIDLCFYI